MFGSFLWIASLLAAITADDVELQPEQLLKDTVSMHNEAQHSIPNFTENIPGEPIADYPVHTKLQNIRFSCIDRTPGHYYADPSQDCQVFHLCVTESHRVSFLCPVGSIFNQRHLVCDWWYNFECGDAEGLYPLDVEENGILVQHEVTTITLNNII